MAKASSLPTIDILKEVIIYIPETGELIWRKNRPKCKAGSIAGGMHSDGYIYVGIYGKRYAAHRIAWLMHYGKDPDNMQIDHINQCKNDNRIINLRLASPAENRHNVSATKGSTTGYKGVSYNKERNKYHAQIMSNRVSYHLGYFETPELAHMAYCKAAAELHGEFARGA
jgi:hypothetical protein